MAATVIIDDSSGTPQTISNDVTNFAFTTPRAVFDWTGVDKSAHERGLGLADISWTINGIYNSASNMSHDVFKTVPSTTVNRTTKIEPTSGSTPYLAGECLFSDYAITRAADGNLTWAVKGDLADGTTPSWS